jgi:large subunit ribosomal protein L4
MIEIPVHNQQGEQVGNLQVDEQTLGGEVRPGLLKQAYVRLHANRRRGTAATRNRARVACSPRKMYRQKGTANARHGSADVNLMRGGGMAFAKQAKSWRQAMPLKMRRLANRNALLAKAVDGEVKLLDKLAFPKPSTRQFAALLTALNIDRSCLLALADTTDLQARSAANLDHVSIIRVDQLNAFDLLNHRFLLVEKEALQAWVAAAGAREPRKQEAR